MRYDFMPPADGGSIRVGRVDITVLHTPRHIPEHCAFVVGRPRRGGVMGARLERGDPVEREPARV